MARRRSKRGEEIRRFLLHQVSEHPRDLVKVAAERFGITRQAAVRYVGEMIRDGLLDAAGEKRQRVYALKQLLNRTVRLERKGLEEDVVWRERLADAMTGLPDNVVEMWNYGFTEMLNNAIDHSDGRAITVSLEKNALMTNMAILDDGIGIFRKIKHACNLEEERQAVLELAKGKLTTDPERHTGEGIFFTSRIMDNFAILSGDVYFSHTSGEAEDWILEVETPRTGTAVFMRLENDSQRSTREVFDHFASDPEDYGFTKTIVPVRMVRQGAEQLVSRSQAKRLLSRLDRFSTVILDFEGVESVGRAFADEIFRVFANSHPGILVMSIRANEEVTRTIEAVRRSER